MSFMLDLKLLTLSDHPNGISFYPEILFGLIFFLPGLCSSKCNEKKCKPVAKMDSGKL